MLLHSLCAVCVNIQLFSQIISSYNFVWPPRTEKLDVVCSLYILDCSCIFFSKNTVIISCYGYVFCLLSVGGYIFNLRCCFVFVCIYVCEREETQVDGRAKCRIEWERGGIEWERLLLESESVKTIMQTDTLEMRCWSPWQQALG